MITQLVREHIRLDDDLVKAMQLDKSGAELLFVATTVTLAGATIVGHDVRIVAERIESTSADPARALVLQHSTAEPPTATAGARGRTLQLFCRHFVNGGATTVGQVGGPGATGAPGRDLVCPPPDPDGPRPGDPEPGVQGGQGKQGATGGPGGLIVARFVTAGTAPSFVSEGGTGGRGGAGGPGGEGCPFNNFGPPGSTGIQGLKGTPTALDVKAFGDAEFQTLADALWFVWAPVRVATAERLFRSSRVREAIAELDAAARMEPTTGGIAALRLLMEHHLTASGTERDLDLLPTNEDPVTAREQADAEFLEDLLPPQGNGTLFHGLDHATLLAGARRVRDAIRRLLQDQLPRMESDRLQRAVAVARMAELTTAYAFECMARIELLDPNEAAMVTLGQANFGVRALADKIEDSLRKDPGRAIISGAPSLLAPQATVNSHIGDLEGSGALDLLAAGAVGLAPALWDAPNAVVDLSRVRDDLRAADGPPALLRELSELAEMAERARLAEWRTKQLAAASAAIEAVRQHATTVQFMLNETNTPESLPPGRIAGNVIEGTRVLLDLLGAAAQRDQRTMQLATLQTAVVGDEPDEATGIAGLAALVHGPDLRADLVEGFGTDLEVDALARLVALDGTTLDYEQYAAKGRFVFGRGNSGVAGLRFTSETHPELLDRLKTDRNFWVDATLDDIPEARRDAKVVGVGLRLEGVLLDSADLLVSVEHSGIARQRSLDGSEHHQALTPASVELTLKRTGGDDIWFAAMRYDDEIDPTDSTPEVGQPHQFPLWTRGAAAGWRVRLIDGGAADLEGLSAFELEIEYDAFVSGASPSLLRVDQPTGALVPGTTVQATARLTDPAPTGGLLLSLHSSDPARFTVPGAVMVPPGADTASFGVQVLAGTNDRPAVITASSPDGFSRRAVVSAADVEPPDGATMRLDLRLPDETKGGIPSVARHDDLVLMSYGGISADPVPAPIGPGCIVVTTPAFADVERVPVGGRPRDIVIDPRRGRALLSFHTGPNGIAALDIATREVIAPPEKLGFGAVSIALDGQRDRLFASYRTQGELRVFEAGSLRIVDIVGGLHGAFGIAADPAAGRIYVAQGRRTGNPDEFVAALGVVERGRGGGLVTTRTIPIPNATQITDAAFDIALAHVYVANMGVAGESMPSITILDRDSLEIVDQVLFPKPVMRIHPLPGAGIIVTTGPTDVLVGDTIRAAFAARRPFGPFPHGFAFDAAGGWIVGDARNGIVERTIPVDHTAVPWR